MTDDIPGIITAVGGLPPSFFITAVGLGFIIWGSSYAKWNKKATPKDRDFRKKVGAVFTAFGFLWMAVITFLPYFIGGPQ